MGNRYRASWVIGLAIISLALTSCSNLGSTKSIADYYAQEIIWTECDESVFLKKEYRFKGFKPSNAVCASVDVPILYENLTLGSKTIAMMGLGDQNNPFIFYNPGGPGASGIEAVQTLDFPDLLDQNYFIVGFDPRGVGISSPVRCDDEADLASYYENDLYIETTAEANLAELDYEKFITECAADNPYWWSVNTANTVKDIELMRVVLTNAPLNFIGTSYGTTLAMEYLRSYPENVGKLMLDSPVLIGLDKDDDRLQQGKGFNDAFERIFTACANDKNCPGESTTAVAELFKQKLVEADQGSVVGYFGIKKSNQNSEFTIASANLMLDGLYQMSYFELEDIYQDFKSGFNDLVKENNSWIFEFYGLLYNGYDPETKERSNINEILYIVNCMDIDSRSFKTKNELRDFDRRYKTAAPIVHYLNSAPNNFFWIPKRQGCEWSWLAFEDESIPNPPTKVLGPVNKSGKQLLIIASTGDNATPYSGAVKVAKQLKSPLVTYDGTGHAVAFNGNPCLTKAISDFFAKTQVELADITCARN